MPRVPREYVDDVLDEDKELQTDMHYLQWYGATDREEGRRREIEYFNDTYYPEEEL